MAAVPRRQKACVPCAESKRRCDKELPECRRCIDKDLDCVYPQPRKRRRDWETERGAQPAFQNPPVTSPDDREQVTGDRSLPDYYVNLDADASWEAMRAGDLDFGDWGFPAADHPEMHFLGDALIPHARAPTAPASSARPDRGPAAERDVNPRGSEPPCPPFFLREETFAIHHKPEDAGCVTTTTVEMEPFIGEVEGMLRAWVTAGSNSFIHRRLYDKGMPTCVQDAFTAFAAYAHRTPATREAVLQIADDRAAALARHAAHPVADGVRAVWAHLARVHALFVYVFIRAFDGSVRMRASAERQLPTLRAWVAQMWEAVRAHRWQDYASVRDGRRRPLPGADTGVDADADAAGEFHGDYDAAMEIWQLWILTESVRRSHLIVETVLNTFRIMTVGWAECEGYVMCTVRRGLWEAGSAVKWLDLCRGAGKSPLMAPTLAPGPLISRYPAGEFDDFARLCWSFVVGTDKIQCWVDKSSSD
ncbi:putative aldo keto protein [Rosellinia necatrix]|uniref:Putative aldo keto protein n=1 Tax=Rosellinia necatrix TaxID=77044 RepID=A0A1W2TQZ2_ROSNE|nr:putative aldo keto protein [Rosellinia necatrix]